MIRICKSKRPRDPNGKVLRVELRLPNGVRVLPVDGPSWRSVAAGIVCLLHGAGVPLRPVRAGKAGRVLLAQRDGWEKQTGEWSQVEETGWYMRDEPMNPHGYLSVVFGTIPIVYGDDDCFIDFEPVYKRPSLRRGSKKYNEDEANLDFTSGSGSDVD